MVTMWIQSVRSFLYYAWVVLHIRISVNLQWAQCIPRIGKVRNPFTINLLLQENVHFNNRTKFNLEFSQCVANIFYAIVVIGVMAVPKHLQPLQLFVENMRSWWIFIINSWQDRNTNRSVSFEVSLFSRIWENWEFSTN